MENSVKQEFTRRLSQCNSGELIVIMYEIVFSYMEDAKAAYESGTYDAYKKAVKKAQDGVEQLKNALNFKYAISKELFSLYMYSYNALAKAIYQNRLDGLLEAEKVLRNLYAAFCEAAKTDTSGPIMCNTQQVYAGITYGRMELNESFIDDNHRGFFV